MNDDVTAYISKLSSWQVDVCERLRALVHETVPGVEERLQYGKPHYLKNGHYAAVIHAAKAKVTFMVFNAGDIEPIKNVLRPLGDGDRKAADIVEGQDPDYDLLADVLGKAASTL
ncbi:DUF1801 domain-containing protein [Nocardioides dilutus]